MLRLVQTCVKRMHLRSKIENFLTDHDLCMCKSWPILLRFTWSMWTGLYHKGKRKHWIDYTGCFLTVVWNLTNVCSVNRWHLMKKTAHWPSAHRSCLQLLVMLPAVAKKLTYLLQLKVGTANGATWAVYFIQMSRVKTKTEPMKSFQSTIEKMCVV